MSIFLSPQALDAISAMVLDAHARLISKFDESQSSLIIEEVHKISMIAHDDINSDRLNKYLQPFLLQRKMIAEKILNSINEEETKLLKELLQYYNHQIKLILYL